MADSNFSTDRGEPQATEGRLAGIARGGADFIRRAASLAAQQEMEQVREQTVERLAPAARSTGMMLAGGALAAYGMAYVVHGVVRALSGRMPPWLASMLVGAAIALGGGALLEAGRRQIKGPDPDPGGNDQGPTPSGQPT